MTFRLLALACAITLSLVVPAAAAGPGTDGATRAWTFDTVPIGTLPPGWVVAATRGTGPLATWQVVADTTAPSGGRVLALTAVNHRSSRTFNLCWTDSVRFRDGRITVRFRAMRGRIDRGGGIAWRIRGPDDYYVARYNPLEDNFRLYRVNGGVRRMLAGASVTLAHDAWHTMTVEQRGDRFVAWLDGEKLLEGHDDHLPGAGGVGLWTKADAVTRFDDFTVTTAEARP